jgi:hypothetical protein
MAFAIGLDEAFIKIAGRAPFHQNISDAWASVIGSLSVIGFCYPNRSKSVTVPGTIHSQ